MTRMRCQPFVCAHLLTPRRAGLREIENGLDLAVHAGVDAVFPGPAAWWGRVGELGGRNESERHKRAAQRDSVAGVVQLRESHHQDEGWDRRNFDDRTGLAQDFDAFAALEVRGDDG